MGRLMSLRVIPFIARHATPHGATHEPVCEPPTGRRPVCGRPVESAHEVLSSPQTGRNNGHTVAEQHAFEESALPEGNAVRPLGARPQSRPRRDLDRYSRADNTYSDVMFRCAGPIADLGATLDAPAPSPTKFELRLTPRPVRRYPPGSRRSGTLHGAEKRIEPQQRLE